MDNDWWEPEREEDDSRIVADFQGWWRQGKLDRIQENLRYERTALAIGRWVFGGRRRFMGHLAGMIWAELRWKGWQLAAQLPPIPEAGRTLLTFDQLGPFIGTFRRDESKQLSVHRGSGSIGEFAKTLARERVAAGRRPPNDRTSRDRTAALAEAFQAPSVWQKIITLRSRYKRYKEERANIEKEAISFALALVTERGGGEGRGRPKSVNHEKRINLESAISHFLDGDRRAAMPRDQVALLRKTGFLKRVEQIRSENPMLSPAEAKSVARKLVAHRYRVKPSTISKSRTRMKTKD